MWDRRHIFLPSAGAQGQTTLRGNRGGGKNDSPFLPGSNNGDVITPAITREEFAEFKERGQADFSLLRSAQMRLMRAVPKAEPEVLLGGGRTGPEPRLPDHSLWRHKGKKKSLRPGDGSVGENGFYTDEAGKRSLSPGTNVKSPCGGVHL